MIKIDKKFVVAFFIGLITAILYAETKNHQFVYDSKLYILLNKNIYNGFSFASLKWAITSTYASNWHPLTWFTHIMDISFYGFNPSGHHITNTILHTANSVLCFFLFLELTKGFWQSAFIALLFALHPLHIESVAWVAERKDLLSCFFFILTILQYSFYVRTQKSKHYIFSLIFFTLGLTSKPMLVTLPFVLLLLDYWPLKRVKEIKWDSNIINLILAKTPFFLLTIASCIITFIAQKEGGAVHPISFSVKIYNIFLSYFSYLYKMVFPFNLAILYPYNNKLTFLDGFLPFFFLVLLTALFIWQMKKRPYLIVGWLWYLGMLVPVIGIIQVGAQSMADRYSYIPLIGIFFLITFFITSKIKNRVVLSILSVMVLSFLFTVSKAQLKHWQTPYTIFQHTVNVTGENAVAQNNLGVNYSVAQNYEKALKHYKAALKINPYHKKALYNLAITLLKQKKYKEALAPLNASLKNFSDDASLYKKYAMALIETKNFKEAIRHLEVSINLDPIDIEARTMLKSVIQMSQSEEKKTMQD